MFDYIIAAGTFLGALYLSKFHQKKKQIWKNFKKVCEENERLFNEFTDEKIEKLARIINEGKNKDNMVLFEDIEKYLDAPKLNDEAINKIKEYYSNAHEYHKKIVYRLLDEVKDYRKESKNLGDKIAKDILKK